MRTPETWNLIHAERSALADTWASLTPEQWAAASWCEGWSVQVTAGHVLAAAEQTIPNFSKEFVQAGFRFEVFADRAARRLATVPPEELVRRLRQRTTTTNHPPAPVVVMLGEIVVHGADIRRPLGLERDVPEAALVAVADNYIGTNLLIGAKRRDRRTPDGGHRRRVGARRRPRSHRPPGIARPGHGGPRRGAR